MKIKWVLLLFVIVIGLIAAINFSMSKSGKLELVKLNYSMPVMDLERINDSEFLLTTMKTFVKTENGTIKLYFGEGELHIIKIDARNKSVRDFWSWKLKGYNIFSFPRIKGDKVAVAVTQGPNVPQNTTLYEIDLKSYTIKKIISIDNFYTITVNMFRDGRFLLTGYSSIGKRKIGKVIVVKSNIVFERQLGNRTTASVIFDFNKDGYEDFLVSSVKFGKNVSSTVYLFLGTSNGFKIARVGKISGMILDAKIIRLKSKKVILVDPHNIYLLDHRIKKVFSVGKKYFIVSLDCVDINKDGIDEIVAVYTNGTKEIFLELKYTNGIFTPVQSCPLNIKCFVIRHLRNGNFIIGSANGLYLIKVTPSLTI